MTLAELQVLAEMALRNHALCGPSCRVRIEAREMLDKINTLASEYDQLKRDLPVYNRHPGVPQHP